MDILIKVEGFSFKEAVKHLQNLSKDIVWEDIKDHQKPIPKYINLRGIHNDYKGDSFGSNKAFSFLLQAKNPTNVVHVCEASIDVLSYASLMKLYQKDYETIHILSLGGVQIPRNDSEHVRDSPPKYGKDVNDDLKTRLGIEKYPRNPCPKRIQTR